MTTASSNVPSWYDYTIDRDDRITDVSERWLAFASENGARELTRGSVIGRSVWEFISDGLTLDVYERLFGKVRRSGKPALMPFRCDSPALRREMQIVLTPKSDDAISISCRHVRTVPRESLRLLDPKTPRSRDRLTVCSFCKRALFEGARTGWVEIEEVEARLQPDRQGRLPELRYGCCGDCAALAR